MNYEQVYYKNRNAIQRQKKEKKQLVDNLHEFMHPTRIALIILIGSYLEMSRYKFEQQIQHHFMVDQKRML